MNAGAKLGAGTTTLPRWARGVIVAWATLAAFLVGCGWAAFARGEAWLSAKWTLPATVAATLGVPPWVPGLVLAIVGLGATGWVVWRMTLGGDARVPRIALPTLAPLSSVRAEARAAAGPPGRPPRSRDPPLHPRDRATPERAQGGERGGAGDRHRPRARPVPGSIAAR